MTTGNDALVELGGAVKAALPGVDLPQLARYRVVRDMVGRLSLQLVSRRDGAPDALPVAIWPGVPGATSEPTPGEEVIVAFAGRDRVPAVLGRAPSGTVSATPIRVRLDATTEIRLAELSDAIVRVGSDAPPDLVQPVAKGPAVETLITALSVFATALGASVDPTVSAAAGALSTALAAITQVSATRLESA